MEWILDNLKLVVFVIIIVVYALKAMKAKEDAGDDGSSTPPSRRTMPGEHDAEEAERTRQIQEEIRRRILARQRGETPTPAAPPPIYVEPEVVEGPPPPPVIVAEQRPVVADPYAQAEHDRTPREASIIEVQQAFQEQLRQIQAARDLAMAAVPKIGSPAAMPGATRFSTAGRVAREDLAGARSLRRAIVLREILGEPVALRTGPAGVTRR